MKTEKCQDSLLSNINNLYLNINQAKDIFFFSSYPLVYNEESIQSLTKVLGVLLILRVLHFKKKSTIVWRPKSVCPFIPGHRLALSGHKKSDNCLSEEWVSELSGWVWYSLALHLFQFCRVVCIFDLYSIWLLYFSFCCLIKIWCLFKICSH